MKKLLIGFIVAALFIPDAQAGRKKNKNKNRGNTTTFMQQSSTNKNVPVNAMSRKNQGRDWKRRQVNGNYPSMPQQMTNNQYGSNPQYSMPRPVQQNNGLPNQMPQPGNSAQFGYTQPGSYNTYDPAGFNLPNNGAPNFANNQSGSAQPGSYNTYGNGFPNQMPQPQQQANNNNLTGGNFNSNASNQYGSSLTGKSLVAEPEEIDYNPRRNSYPSIPQGTNSWGQTSNLRRAQSDYQVDYRVGGADESRGGGVDESRGGGADESRPFNSVAAARAFWEKRIAQEQNNS